VIEIKCKNFYSIFLNALLAQLGPLDQFYILEYCTNKELDMQCAVFKLPTQTLLLAPTDKPGRMNGMLFPGVCESFLNLFLLLFLVN
jgi:hypothetical protein